MYNQVLTNSGAALLRDAVNAEKKIVFTRAICGSHYDMDSRGDLASKPLDWYDGIDGSILAVSVAGGILSVIASFSGSGSAPIKSVCICAQKKKDGVTPTYDKKDDIIIAATCDDNSCYLSGDSFKIRFDLPIALSGIVDPVGEIDPLPNNVVTTTGPEQYIHGVTTFSEDDNTAVILNGSVRMTDLYDEDEIYAEFSVGSLMLGDKNTDREYNYVTMPLKCEYNTTSGTVDLTLGNGTKIRLTCTNVEEVSE